MRLLFSLGRTLIQQRDRRIFFDGEDLDDVEITEKSLGDDL